MTVDDQTDDPMGREPTDEELGPAMDLLPEGADDRDERFTARVRRAIHRRLLGSSVIEFCLVAPLVVLLELGATIHYLLCDTDDEGSRR